MRWPQGGIGGGKSIPALSTHMDILPTLIDLCGLTGPPTLKFDGRSLAPLLQNRIREWPDDRTVFVHNQRVEYPVKDKEYQVLTEKWRLVKRDKDELYHIQDDAGQSRDLAAQYPDVVKDLYRRYEQWWKDVYPRTDEYAAIHIGSPYEERVTLFPHDAHKREGKSIWVVRVDQAGRYRIKLNRWPEESGKRIVENIKGDKQISIQSGHLQAGNITVKKVVTTDMTSIYFDVDLSEGITCLELYFKQDDIDKVMGSGWVYVERKEAADAAQLRNYIPSNPDQVLRKNFKEVIEPYN